MSYIIFFLWDNILNFFILIDFYSCDFLNKKETLNFINKFSFINFLFYKYLTLFLLKLYYYVIHIFIIIIYSNMPNSFIKSYYSYYIIFKNFISKKKQYFLKKYLKRQRLRRLYFKFYSIKHFKILFFFLFIIIIFLMWKKRSTYYKYSYVFMYFKFYVLSILICGILVNIFSSKFIAILLGLMISFLLIYLKLN